MSMKIGIITLNKTYSLRNPSEEVVVVDTTFNSDTMETYILFNDVKNKDRVERRCLTQEEFAKRVVWDETNSGTYTVS